MAAGELLMTRTGFAKGFTQRFTLRFIHRPAAARLDTAAS
jgi:hypothetical protein